MASSLHHAVMHLQCEHLRWVMVSARLCSGLLAMLPNCWLMLEVSGQQPVVGTAAWMDISDQLQAQPTHHPPHVCTQGDAERADVRSLHTKLDKVHDQVRAMSTTCL